MTPLAVLNLLLLYLLFYLFKSKENSYEQEVRFIKSRRFDAIEWNDIYLNEHESRLYTIEKNFFIQKHKTNIYTGPALKNKNLYSSEQVYKKILYYLVRMNVADDVDINYSDYEIRW